MANDMNLQINITGTNNSGSAFESMDSAIASAQEALNSLIKASQSASEAFSRIGQVGQETGRAVESGMQAAQQGVRNTSEAITATIGPVERLGQALSAEMIGEQLKSIGEIGMRSFEGMVHAAADFEYNISRIGAVLTTSGKATSRQMQQMSADALKLGSNSSFSANQIAEGMYTLARQGLDATTILGDGVNGAINIVNDLAQATDSDMTDTATVITDVVHEYGLSGNALRDVANTMSGALHNSSESLDDFYQSMKQVGPVASAMHQNALDMSTALALLAQHGITGSSAGTALKNMLLGLSPRTKAAAADFAELGISVKNGATNSFFDLQGNLRPLPDIINLLNEKFNGLSDAQKQAALSTVFTKYGLAGLNTIVGESRDKFLDFQNELRKDDAATIAAKKMDNLHGDLLKFNAGVQTMMKSFGDSINGMLRPIVQGASEAIKWLTELPEPVKKAGMAILGIGSVLAIAAGGVIAFIAGLSLLAPGLEIAGVEATTLGGTLLGIGGLLSEILIPVGLVAIAVAGLAYAWSTNFDGIRDKVSEFGGKVSEVFTNVKNLTEGVFMILSGTGGGKGIDLLQKIGVGKNTIQELMKTGGQIRVFFQTLTDDIGKAFSKLFSGKNDLGSSFSKIFNSIKSVALPILKDIVNFVKDGISRIKQFWDKDGDKIIQAVKDAVKLLADTFDNVLKPALLATWDTIKSVGVPLFNKFMDAVEFLGGKMNWVIPILGGVVSAIGAFKIINTIIDLYKSWQIVTKSMTIAQAALNLVLDANPIGIVVIAIGALVAAGIALYENWDTVKNKMQVVWMEIKAGAQDAINGVIDKINDLIRLIDKIPGVKVPLIPQVNLDVLSSVRAAPGTAPKGLGHMGGAQKAFASGTDFAPGGLALVGEQGPELVNLPRGSQVFTASQTRSFMNPSVALSAGRSSGGSNNYYITINASGNITRNERELADIISKGILNKVKMQGKI